jgi:hypothetical protein
MKLVSSNDWPIERSDPLTDLRIAFGIWVRCKRCGAAHEPVPDGALPICSARLKVVSSRRALPKQT